MRLILVRRRAAVRGLTACIAAGVLLAGCAPPTVQEHPAAREEFPAGQPLGVEILWDGYGVPHIFAQDRRGLAYGLGWAQMRNHADLLLRLYAQGRGRAAELLGEPLLAEDRWVWQMGIPARSEAWLSAQGPEMRAHLRAFTAGINAFALAHPELVSESVRPVLPVTEIDVIGAAQRLAFSAFITSRASVRAGTSAWQERGSNAWAIAPERSASGHALLLVNPHLPWGDLLTWMEVQLSMPGMNFSGAGFVGLPVPMLGFNDRLGWAHTVNTQDGEDLYELTLAGGGYEWDGGVRAFETERHVLRVRSGDTAYADTLVVRRSVHGPVIAEKPGKAIALRVVGLDLPHALEQWWAMASAQNLTEFERAIRPNQISTQNIIYADADGRIMFFYGGNTPVRPGREPIPGQAGRGTAPLMQRDPAARAAERAFWEGIIRGNTSATLWTRLHGFDDMPWIVDPPGGWVQNANDPPWWATFPTVLDPLDYPDYLAPLPMSLRAQRSAIMLYEDPTISFDELRAYKHSTEMELANRVLEDLLAAADRSADQEAQAAAGVLRAWDRRADSGSAGAVLFVEWWSEYQRRLRGGNPFARAWTAAGPLNTPHGLADTSAAVSALSAAAESIRSAHGSLDVAWGDVYRVRRDDVDLPSNGAPQAYGVFRSVGYVRMRDGKQVAVGGDSYVAIVEFGPIVRANSVLGYGNASRAGSPHRVNQLPLFAEQRLKPVLRTRAEIEPHVELVERF